MSKKAKTERDDPRLIAWYGSQEIVDEILDFDEDRMMDELDTLLDSTTPERKEAKHDAFQALLDY